MNPTVTRPENLIADSIDFIEQNGMKIRKGTVAAFLANITLLESSGTSNEEKMQALAVMEELAPGIIAIGLHKHVTFNNAAAAKILALADEKLSKG